MNTKTITIPKTEHDRMQTIMKRYELITLTNPYFRDLAESQ